MRLKSIFALTLVLAPMTALSGAGLDNFYGVTMAACVPTGQTSAHSLLFNSAGEASFRDGGFGEIILTCPIPNTLARITRMTVRYKDDGGRAAGSQVVTALRQKRMSSTGWRGCGLRPIDDCRDGQQQLCPAGRVASGLPRPPEGCDADLQSPQVRLLPAGQHAPAGGDRGTGDGGARHAVLSPGYRRGGEGHAISALANPGGATAAD